MRPCKHNIKQHFLNIPLLKKIYVVSVFHVDILTSVSFSFSWIDQPKKINYIDASFIYFVMLCMCCNKKETKTLT